ncbi:iron-sulfur protein [Streptomyces minutiscleroticus]|uniref:Cytochrome bc1 complex Rieske iron-sulfur subunit n=1 Tax=Streptomyces minutiscleroticus TaxID=68238 RepID=A0A918U6W8_9ACTN|nr:Rieske (2Fe-2S) protein [Streptomyces minutiscleroticus]GGX99954.1 iron-sulfur protein [Streptomyces minutiscleroticus]
MHRTSFGAASGPARRAVLAAAGAAGAAAALTACGGSDDGSPGSDTAAPADGGNGAPEGGEAGADGGGRALASTADIPEGGGKVFAGQEVVVTQPRAGEFRAFSSKCTHRGCAVKGVADGVITCPCHDSRFSAEDGSVEKGPATGPLPAVRITVDGESIRLA